MGGELPTFNSDEVLSKYKHYAQNSWHESFSKRPKLKFKGRSQKLLEICLESTFWCSNHLLGMFQFKPHRRWNLELGWIEPVRRPLQEENNLLSFQSVCKASLAFNTN